MLREVRAIRYVTPLREGGSLPGLVEADDDGMYVVKFRGAGQGPKALVAEVICAGLAAALELPVPELVRAEVDPALGRTEADPEIAELIRASEGTNLGVDFLPGALDLNPAVPGLVGAELAAAVVWFDALITNVDRTARNPNLLIWHRRPWLIDHGAAIYQHHAARELTVRAREPFPGIRDHVLLPAAGSILAADEQLGGRLEAAEIDAALAAVPDGWLGEHPTAARAAYRAWLLARLEAPREFAAEAEAARGG